MNEVTSIETKPWDNKWVTTVTTELGTFCFTSGTPESAFMMVRRLIERESAQEAPAHPLDQILNLREELAEARNKAIEECAVFAEADFRSKMAVENGFIPEWLKHGRRIAEGLRKLKGHHQ